MSDSSESLIKVEERTLLNFYGLRDTISYQISQEMYPLKVSLRVVVHSTSSFGRSAGSVSITRSILTEGNWLRFILNRFLMLGDTL